MAQGSRTFPRECSCWPAAPASGTLPTIHAFYLDGFTRCEGRRHRWCGRSGCIERFVSGPGLSASHEARTGDALPPAVIHDLAEAGNAAAKTSMDRHADQVARALAHVINLLDPEVIVLGGGLSRMRGLYSRVARLWPEYVYGGSAVTRLVPAAHGDASGVRGAARLWDSD